MHHILLGYPSNTYIWAVGIANVSQHCRTGGGVLFNTENATFWPILANLATFVAIYALFRVLFQALVMRWWTKIDKYDVWQWTHYCQVLILAKLERPTRRRTTWYLVAWLVDCGGRVGLHLWLTQVDLCVFSNSICVLLGIRLLVFEILSSDFCLPFWIYLSVNIYKNTSKHINPRSYRNICLDDMTSKRTM